MSNPSFENIDQWLFEYTEGNLSPNQVTQLERFLLNNPEFDADMDAWQSAKVDATPVVFPGIVGRKRKPVPFWLIPSLVFAVTFAAGGFFGAYLVSPDTLQLEDAASVAQSLPIENNKSLLALSFKAKVDVENNDVENKSQQINYISSRDKVQNSNYSLNSITQSKSDEMDNNLYLTTSNKVNFGLQTQNAELRSVPLSSDEFSVVEKDLTIHDENPNNTQNEIIVPNADNQVITQETDLTVIKAPLANIEPIVSVVSDEEVTESNLPKSKKLEKDDMNGGEMDQAITAKAMTRGDRISSNYQTSFASTMKSTWRKVVRMTDNPIALTNSKDIYYHAPGMQTLNVNFATAGNLLKTRVQSISRAQWTGHSNQQLMNELSLDTYVRSIRGGIGVQLNHAYYNNGTYNVGQIALTYSPKFTVKRNFSIEPAVRIKMGDKRLNAKNLVPGQLIEMDRGNKQIFYNETPENLVKDLWYKDIGLGLSSNTKWFSVGFQADNLGRHFNNAYNSSNENDRAGVHYTGTIGMDFVSRSKIISFSPYLMYQKVENLSEIWGGSIFRYNILTLGGGISSSGDYAGSIGLKTDRFMLTYNVDYTRSYLADKRLFSQQLTIRILMKNGYK